MSTVVREKLFSGEFPVYPYMYTLRQFMRMNCVRKQDIEDFVVALGGKRLSVREIEQLAQGYFRGPASFREAIRQGHVAMRDHLQLDAFAGHLYLFANKRRDRLKILYWDRDGFAVWAKRLEAGTYVIPSADAGASRLEITTEGLGALLSGIDLSSAHRRKRYQRANQ
jgi:transposase